MISFDHFVGIDYGAKLAGTTTLTIAIGSRLYTYQSSKNQDADQFLKELILENNLVTQVFIDAPLSLPGGYYGITDNYSMRDVDIKLQAMSPMFLGGLTARAIAFKHQLTRIRDIHCFEVYPGGFIKKNKLAEFYHKKDRQKIESFLNIFQESLSPFQIRSEINNWHQVDSIIAWTIGYLFQNGKATSYGNETEGLIWV